MSHNTDRGHTSVSGQRFAEGKHLNISTPSEDLTEEEESEERPELEISPKERRLITQPFDFVVGSLEKQIRDKELLLQDDYQRRQVWDDIKSSRLIESLLLNVPIPVCYFSELEDGSYSVIDGQQRLTAIWRFIMNLKPLRGLRVRSELNKKRFSELDAQDQRLIRNRTIRCIVIQKESHPEIRFDVFERLNSASVKLNPQELRNSTYRGKLNSLLRELCESESFKKIRRVRDSDTRMKDAEMVLRFFAFHFNRKNYKGYFSPFLDDYLASGSKMRDEDLDKHRKLFDETIQKVQLIFGDNAFRQIDVDGNFANQVNRAVYDVIMLSFPYISRDILTDNKDSIITALKKLCNESSEFSDAIGRATRDKHRINSRMRLWREEMQRIGISLPDLSYGE